MSPVTANYSKDNDAEPSATRRRSKAADRLAAWTPYLLAVVFAFSALRGVGQTDLIDTDAARHAMNGVFIYDLVRTGHIAHPIEYARRYYGQYPALSMPYHPPLFPAVEAVLFAIFGVTFLTARAAVALAAGICAFLLYYFVLARLKRSLLAACVTVTTLSLWTSQLVARDVMLEFPSLVFTLAAAYCLRDLDRSYPMRRAILFALLAGAAVWTKQHAVFLAAIPPLYFVFTRRWRRLFEAPLWISTAVLGAIVYALLALAKPFNGAGVNQMSTSGSDVYYILTRSLPAYFNWIKEGIQGLPLAFTVFAAAVYFWGRRKAAESDRPRLGLCLAWIVAVAALLIDLGPVSPRYFFFVFPALFIVGYAWLFHGCRWIWGDRAAGFAAAGFAVCWAIAGWVGPVEYLRGPSAAARLVAQGSATRVLYIGSAEATFIFGVRERDPNLQVTVIPSAKLPKNQLEPGAVEGFCRQYGVEWVVLENPSDRQPWPGVDRALAAVARQRQSIPLESNRWRWRGGTMEVFRLVVPAQRPGGVLEFPVPKLGGSIPVTF